MKVAACQLPEIRNDVVRAMSLIGVYTHEAERHGASIVCFPECFLQGYDMRPEHVANVAIELSSSAFDEMLRTFELLKPVVVFGLIEKDAGVFYNSAVAVERGKVLARYRKTHLLKGEKSVFGYGDGSPIFDVPGARVGFNICYDLSFSESVERVVDAGATLLVCPCSNMMPRDLAEEWRPRHNEIRSQHAKKHGVWIASSDIIGERDDWISYGPTAVIDPLGTVVAQVPVLETGMVVAEIE